MEIQEIKKFLSGVYKRVYNLEKRINKIIPINIKFLLDNKETHYFKNEHRSFLSNIDRLIKINKPDTIIIDYEYDGQKKILPFELKDEEINHSTKVDNLVGLGEIDNIITKRLEEERRNKEFLDLNKQLEELYEELEDKQQELDHITKQKEEQIIDLKAQLEETIEEVGNLELQLEVKNKIRHCLTYAGDILQGFGIKKESIKGPLSGLLGLNNEPQEKLIQQDNSCIVEEDFALKPKNQQRNDLLDLISDYLQNIDNDTLAQIFEILSYIEQDKSKANKIITFLKNKQHD